MPKKSYRNQGWSPLLERLGETMHPLRERDPREPPTDLSPSLPRPEVRALATKSLSAMEGWGA